MPSETHALPCHNAAEPVHNLPTSWGTKIRTGGLAVILLRAGLKIDKVAFNRAPLWVSCSVCCKLVCCVSRTGSSTPLWLSRRDMWMSACPERPSIRSTAVCLEDSLLDAAVAPGHIMGNCCLSVICMPNMNKAQPWRLLVP